MPGMRIVVMGPSGSGKSLIGARLAERLHLPFLDADALHPPANVAKMSAGVPLTDADRRPWLDAVGAAIGGHPDGVVMACSALRRSYRDRLRAAAPDTIFVELGSDHETLLARMTDRAHFMPPSLLDSQLESLEPLDAAESGIRVLNTDAPEAVVDRVIEQLSRPQSLR